MKATEILRQRAADLRMAARMPIPESMREVLETEAKNLDEEVEMLEAEPNHPLNQVIEAVNRLEEMEQ